MHLRAKHVALTAIVLALLLAGAFLGWRQQTSRAAKPVRDPVQTVKLAQAEQRTVPLSVNANGFVTSINTVDVRPQTQNIVRAIHVREGQEVKPGDLLFTLDE